MYSFSGLGGLGAPRARAFVAAPAAYAPPAPIVSARVYVPSTVAPPITGYTSPVVTYATTPPRISPGVVSASMVAPSPIVPALPSSAVQAIIPITAWFDRFRRPRQWPAGQYQAGGEQVQMQDDGSGTSQASATDTSAASSASSSAMQAPAAGTDWGLVAKVSAVAVVAGGAFYMYKRRRK